jgi:hypothetical protein
MATNTAGSTAREYATQQIHYLRKQITEADEGTTVTVGTIPAGATILRVISGVQVDVAFNGTSPIVDIGVSGTAERFGANLTLAAIAFVPNGVTDALNTMAADTTILAAVSATGNDSTAGVAQVIIAYCPNI